MKFSIVIPTYNRAHLIIDTLKSIYNQNFLDYEIIIVDDGSTDNTEEVIRGISNTQTYYYKIRNSERSFARNFGAKLAKGDYINFFDSDDIALPNHLFEANKFINELNKPEVIHLNYAITDEKLNIIEKKSPPAKLANQFLLKGNLLSCNNVFLKREIALKHPFNENRALTASEDWDLWLKLSVRFPIYMSHVVTSFVVNHDGRSVMRFNEKKDVLRIDALLQSLKSDDLFMKKNPNALKTIKAHMFSYLSLHSILCHERKKSLKYLYHAVKTNYKEIFTKRFLAILKRLVLF